jgi:protein-histidine pros-kinase
LGRHVSVVNASTEKSSEETASEISRVLNEKGEWNGEVLNIRKDGTTFWCYANVSTFYHPEHGMVWIAVHTDITMIKKFREALQQSEERFRSTMQSAYDAIIVVDGKGNIILWNNGAKNIFGYSEEEVMGKPLTTMMPEKYRLAHTNMLEMVTSNGKSRLIGQILELYGLRKDGVEFPIELTIGTWMVGNDRFYSGIIRDISERKKSEELHQENMKLSYANKLKSEFLAIMSHELRTPLNAILGFSDLLLNKTIGEINEKQEKYIENIRLGGNRLLSTVDIILEMTKIEAGKIDVLFEKISVPQTVEECLILIKENAAKNKIILDTEFDQQTELIEADRQKLKMVLFNLLDNAVKFSKPEGGRVTIAVKKDGNMAKFSISDTGIGIKEEDLAGVFREFNQIDSGLGRRYGGIGLGLAISKRLVELHGGEIKAISKYGEGSTFTFTIPIKRI